MMDKFFLMFLLNSLGMSIIVMILLGIESIMIRKSNAFWRQWLWFAVVLGFLLPLRPDYSFFHLNEPVISLFIDSSDRSSSDLSNPSPETAVAPDSETAVAPASPGNTEQTSGPIIKQTSSLSESPSQVFTSKTINSNKDGHQKDVSSDKTLHPQRKQVNSPLDNTSAYASWSGLKFALQPAIPYIVLTGFCVMIFIQFIRYRRFLTAITRWSRPVEDPETLILYGSIAIELGIKKDIPLIQSNLFSSPFLFGFLHPIVLLPQEDFPEEELALILRHELIHYKKGHLWIRFFGFLATAVNWYNPFSYLAARTLGYECEQACDETIAQSSGEEQRYLYSETILSVVRKTGKMASNPFGIPRRKNIIDPPNSDFDNNEDFSRIRNRQDYETLFTTGFYKGMNGVKQRLTLILEPSVGKAGGLFFGLTVLTIFLSGSIFGIASPDKKLDRSVRINSKQIQNVGKIESKNILDQSKINSTIDSNNPSKMISFDKKNDSLTKKESAKNNRSADNESAVSENAISKITAPNTSPKTNSPKTNSPKTNSPKTNSPKTNSPKTNSPDTEAEITNTAFFTEDSPSDSNISSETKDNDPLEFRTWKDLSGRFSILATLAEQKGTKVKLKKKNGRTITISMTRLSREDQEYLKKLSENPFAFGEPEEELSPTDSQTAQNSTHEKAKETAIKTSEKTVKKSDDSSVNNSVNNSETDTFESIPATALPLKVARLSAAPQVTGESKELKSQTIASKIKTTQSDEKSSGSDSLTLESRFPSRLYEIEELKKSFVMGDRSTEKSLVPGGRSLKWNYTPGPFEVTAPQNEKRVNVAPFSASQFDNELSFFEQKLFFASASNAQTDLNRRTAFLSFHTGVLDQARYYLNKIDTATGASFLYELPFRAICFGVSPNGKRLLALHQYKRDNVGFDTKQLLAVLDIGEKALKPAFEFLPYLSAANQKSRKFRFSTGLEGSFENACWIDEDHILTGNRDTVIFWDLTDCRSIWAIRTKFETVAVSPDRKVFLAASTSGVNLYDLRSGDLLGILTGHLSNIQACSFSPDGKRAALLTSNSLAVYDLATGDPVTEITRSADLKVRPIWTDNENILLGDILYNIEKQLPLCRYRNLPIKNSAAALHRGLLWTVIGNTRSSALLTSCVLPQKDLLEKLTKIDKKDFLLSPGAKVRLEFDLNDLLDESKVKEDLIKNLELRKFTVEDQAQIVVKVAVADTGKKVNVSYGQSNVRMPGFLPSPPPFMGSRTKELGSVDLKLFSQKISITVKDKEIWKFETFTTGPQSVEYDPKKTIEDSVRESNHPLPHFVRTAPIPDYISKSGQAFGALFNAEITPNGVR